MSTKSDWIRAQRGRLCPLCKADKYCSWALGDDGQIDAVCCTRPELADTGGYHELKRTADGRATIFKRGEKRTRGGAGDSGSGGAGFAELVKSWQMELDGERLARFATLLGVTPDALKKLRIGWNAKRRAITFPEVNFRRAIIGVNYQDEIDRSRKWMARGSKRGLFVPTNLTSLPDPVLIVEGASDTAACVMCGLAAVGRPSDRGGVEHLTGLLRGRECIVVGEWDMKISGAWPGRDAAQAVAGQLALAWGEPVGWAMTPDFVKDVRKWITRESPEAPEAIGRDLIAKLREHIKMESGPVGAHPSSRELVANVLAKIENDKTLSVNIPLPHIAQHLQRIANGWPRRINGTLFVGPDEPPSDGTLHTHTCWHPLQKTDALFGWIHSLFDVRWTKEEAQDPFTGELRNPPSKGEFHAALSASIEPDYGTIELLPHEPPLEGSWYAPVRLPEGDGSAIAELRERLNGETDFDRDLMIACLLTIGWGGPPGKRPGFVFTTDHGRGVGKTTTAAMLAAVWGGEIWVDEHEDWERVRSRLLADESLTKRCVLIDNVRGRLARSGLESAITSHTIDGHKMYKGQASRPNTITWLMTSNAPKLSSDLTQRAVVLRLGKPRHEDAEFEAWWMRFFEDHRAHLIADCMARLKAGPVAEIRHEDRDRWGPWIDGVLSTFANASDLLKYIREGRPQVDEDLRDAQEIRDLINTIKMRMDLPTEGAIAECTAFTIRKEDFRLWLVHEGLIEKSKSKKAVTSWLELMSTYPPLAGFSEFKGRGQGRRWFYHGSLWQPSEPIWHYDVDVHGLPDQHGVDDPLGRTRSSKQDELFDEDAPPLGPPLGPPLDPPLDPDLPV